MSRAGARGHVLTAPAPFAGRRHGRPAQFVRALLTRPDARIDARLEALLASDAQWALLQRLSPFDRAHHLRVHDLLVEWGHIDPDLLRAALMHDVGKADERGRVRAVHRVAVVMLRALAPGVLRLVARADRRGVLHGLYLAGHHAQLGAERAGRSGASARCCELIALHESPVAGDAELAALIAADSIAVT